MLARHCCETFFIFLFSCPYWTAPRTKMSKGGRAGSAHFMDRLLWMVRIKIDLLSSCKFCWSGKGLLHRIPRTTVVTGFVSLYLPFPPFFSLLGTFSLEASSPPKYTAHLVHFFSVSPGFVDCIALLHIYSMTALVTSPLVISSIKLEPSQLRR